MPYIEQGRRDQMDKVIESMVEAGVKCNGDLNYILFKFCKYHVPRSYNNIKNFNGELAETSAEIRRKLLSSHEDIKEIENGLI
jgi:hypothetical protein